MIETRKMSFIKNIEYKILFLCLFCKIRKKIKSKIRLAILKQYLKRSVELIIKFLDLKPYTLMSSFTIWLKKSSRCNNCLIFLLFTIWKNDKGLSLTSSKLVNILVKYWKWTLEARKSFFIGWEGIKQIQHYI